MSGRFLFTFLSLVAAVLSLLLLGLQLIGSSSDASYAIQLVVGVAIVIAYYRLFERVSGRLLVVGAMAVAVTFSLLPIESSFFLNMFDGMSDAGRIGSEIVSAEQRRTFIVSWLAIVAAHTVLLSISAFLWRHRSNDITG